MHTRLLKLRRRLRASPPSLITIKNKKTDAGLDIRPGALYHSSKLFILRTIQINRLRIKRRKEAFVKQRFAFEKQKYAFTYKSQGNYK